VIKTTISLVLGGACLSSHCVVQSVTVTFNRASRVDGV
jgi:hypothetical protein